MMAVLSAQKVHYNQMKVRYNQSQTQIRTLERQIGAMHRELDVCSNMFLNADQTFRSRLTARIDTLLCEKTKLLEKLAWTERKLVTMAAEKNITWLDSMLAYCSKETEQFKDDLHACRFRLAATDEQLRNSESNQARWRFEALKLRCLLMNRESLLESNKIAFKTEAAADVERQIKQLGAAAEHPNIQIDVKNIRRRLSSSTMENKENIIKTEPPPSPLISIKEKETASTTKPIVVKSSPLAAPPPLPPVVKIEMPPPPPSPQIPTYRPISHTPETMAMLSKNWDLIIEQEREARRPLSEKFPSARGLFTGGNGGDGIVAKKKVNFSDSTTTVSVENEESVFSMKHESSSRKPETSNGAAATPKMQRNCITKRLVIKSKLPDT